MGQRLNIEITNRNGCIANCYYHWSAYTFSSIAMTRQILAAIDEDDEEFGTEYAVMLLERTGGGVDEEERERIKADARYSGMHFNECSDRNRGLIAVTKEGIRDTRNWEEGRVTVNLDTRTVDFDVFWRYNSVEEYEEENETDAPDGIYKTAMDFSNIPFDSFDEFAAVVAEHPDGVVDDDGTYYRWIE